MNAPRYGHILSRLLNEPLWLHPSKAAIIYNLIATREGLGLLTVDVPRGTPESTRFVGEWPASQEPGNTRSTEPFKLTKSGVGVITMTGTLVNRGAWVGSYSGQTSYEGVKHQLARVARDGRVKSVILDIDSPGGEANGALETAAAVRSVAAHKPVIAVANGMAASAAYALASGATKIIVSPSGVAGSIGTVLLHLDFSRQLDKEGVTPTFLYAGSRKIDGNPLHPLGDTAMATLQGEVDRYYELFLETVAAGRGRRTPIKAARETEGRTYIGREAIDARLADDVGTFEEVLSDLTRRADRPAVERPAAPASQARRRSAVEQPLLEPEADANSVTRAELERAISEAEARGAAGVIARFKAIAAEPRVKGKEAFALRLACEAPQMTADGVASLCDQVPAAGVPSSIAERAHETGAEGVTSVPIPADQRQQVAAAGWDRAIAETNARTASERVIVGRRRSVATH